MKNPPYLSETAMRRILEALQQANKSSNGRPWMVVIRQTDGVIQVYEAQAPVRIDMREASQLQP